MAELGDIHLWRLLMDALDVELTAALVDNPATPSQRTKVDVTLENPVGRLSVENHEGSPRSVHRFAVTDATDLGCGGAYNLTVEEARDVLAISCSLANPRILFSPSQPNQLAASLKFGQVPSKAEVVDTPTGKHRIIKETIRIPESVVRVDMTTLSVDEAEVLNVAKRLLAARIFDTANRSLLELNILESIKSYREALMSASGLTCFQSLYNAFEKAVNADRERKERVFDVAACALTGLTESEVKSLRLFNNRVKHALRNNRDVNALKTGEAQLRQLARNLKRAADKAILSRI